MNKLGNSPAAGHHFTRFLKLKNYNPTQGELLIMVNKEHNRHSPASWAKSQHYLLSSREEDFSSESYFLKPEQRVESTQPTRAENSNAPRPITGESAYQRVVSAQSVQGEGITLKSKASGEDNLLEETEENASRHSRIEISTTLPDINNNST